MTHRTKIATFAGVALLVFSVNANVYAETSKSFPGITFVSNTKPEVAISLHHGTWHIHLTGDYSKDAAKIKIVDTPENRQNGEPGLPLQVEQLEHADRFGLPPTFAIQRRMTGEITCEGCTVSRHLWEIHKAK